MKKRQNYGLAFQCLEFSSFDIISESMEAVNFFSIPDFAPKTVSVCAVNQVLINKSQSEQGDSPALCL